MSEKSLFRTERRRYRRLECALPVRVQLDDEGDPRSAAPGSNAPGSTSRDGANESAGNGFDSCNTWIEGCTRDISVGGCQISVPPGEEGFWREAANRHALCRLYFEACGEPGSEEVRGRLANVRCDDLGEECLLDIAYVRGAERSKRQAVRVALRSRMARHHLQTTLHFSAIGVVVLWMALGSTSIQELREQNSAQNRRIAQMKAEGQQAARRAALWRAPQRQRPQEKALARRIAALSDPHLLARGEQWRTQERQALGLPPGSLSPTALANRKVQVGVAWPRDYAWPQLTSTLEELLGRRVPLVAVFRDFRAPFPLGDCQEARWRGKTLMITWEPWHFATRRGVPLRDIARGRHDAYLDSWAKTARAYGGEVWIRWGHEFNGSWYPWSLAANGRNPHFYVAAFRHVRDRFTRQGASNVRWVWGINADSLPVAPWNDPLRAYPGDAWVDAIAIDGYNFGAGGQEPRWRSFEQIFAGPYARVVKAHPRKPVLIGETACSTKGGNKATWVRNMDRSLRTRFPRVEAVIWFEAKKEADWRMDWPPTVLTASRDVWNQEYYRRGLF